MGKSSLLIVLGFFVALAVALPNINRLATRSVDNYLSYQATSTAHNIAVSGANVAASAVFIDPTLRPVYPNITFSGGSYNVTSANYLTDQVKIVSIGTYRSVVDTCVVILQPSVFSKFAYYSQLENGINWITKDTVYGPFHTEDIMTINGSPTFQGKVTTLKGTNPKKSSANFNGGYQSGVSLVLPTSLSSVTTGADSGGKVISGDLWIKFAKDTVKWKTTAGGSYTSTLLSAFTTNGVIQARSGNVHVQGTLKGRVTLSATGSSGKGNIYIDDDVKYNTDPRTATTTDILGLVADNNVVISDSSGKLNQHDVMIQASVFSRTGGLTAENYNNGVLRGTIYLLGGVIQYSRGAVGTASGGTISSGFQKSYMYDTRFYVDHPPFFPNTGGYEVISWLE